MSVFGYLMPPNSSDLCQFVNHWLDMRRADGFLQALHDYWILGKPRPKIEPRWCILRDVLHWVR
ncbi:MAG: hypothetical protein FJ278_23360 [Planctomycetes bacterium]|nr:hypothetical protein [Planctomycetota bacterium]